MTETYALQLEEENEKLRKQLTEAQKTVDHMCPVWREVSNEHGTFHLIEIGNICLGIIKYIANDPGPCYATNSGTRLDNYQVHKISFTGHEDWQWSPPVVAGPTLEHAKEKLLWSLGFGELKRTHDYDGTESAHGCDWMAVPILHPDQVLAKINVPFTRIP